MRLQRINYAEAIIEPFYDGSDSDRTDKKFSQLEHYRVTASDPVKVKAEQNWHGVQVQMDRGQAAWLEMTRTCRLNIEGFDIFRIFGSIPGCVRQTVRARIDGQWVTVCDQAPGTNNTDEQDYPVSGKELTELTIRLEQDGERDSACVLYWLGLSNRQREQAMLALRSEFTPDWPDMLQEGDFEPAIGIWFDGKELEPMRKRLHTPPFAPIYEKMRQEAEAALDAQPEQNIGEYIGNPDRRWVRARDRNNPSTAEIMTKLAFVGLVEKDSRMMRMAVRMALSVAHCDKWTESIMGALPGCSWHHRSFTEEIYCRACALVLDWAGSWLTSYGAHAVLDAIIMKGLPRLESDFKRYEYIRRMNQGIVFSSGRIFGLLACCHFYSRYDSQLREAEKDLYEMLDAYILPDGGSVEGPSYWNYTFSQAIPIFYVLSRYHNKPLGDVVPKNMAKSGIHALSLLSITGKGNYSIPVNDAHSRVFEPSLMAALYEITGDEAYRTLLMLNLEAKNTQPDFAMFIMAPNDLSAPDGFRQEGFTALPDLGQTRIIRSHPDFGRVSLSFFSGSADIGHYHMDKGSFVLETEQEALLIDRGVTSYNHPDTQLMQLPEYHNMLIPQLPGERLLQEPTLDGAVLKKAIFENGCFETTGDITRAWDDPRIRKQTRDIRSDRPDHFIVTDVLELEEEWDAVFWLQTHAACEAAENGVCVVGEHARVTITGVNWQPKVSWETFGVDSELRPVCRIGLRSAPARSHTLITEITLATL